MVLKVIESRTQQTKRDGIQAYLTKVWIITCAFNKAESIQSDELIRARVQGLSVASNVQGQTLEGVYHG